MSAYLYQSQLRHVRTGTPSRSFTYRGYLWLVDLDELPQQPRILRTLARIEARDHLGDPTLPIRANVEELLSRHRIDLAGGRILMLANARVLGRAFNPLTLFWCYHVDGSLACVIAEVHNTYHGRHEYVLTTDNRGGASVTKSFYVSPFLPMGGQYHMRLRPPGERLDVRIALRHGSRTLLVATLRGTRRPATVGNLLRMALRYPLSPLAVGARIRLQGIRLLLRGAPIQPPPDPTSPQNNIGGAL